MPSITSLLTATALSGTEPLPVDQSGATVKATVNQVKTYVNTTPAITGGSINSTPIGATTPSTGAFTTLVGTNGASIKGTVNPTSGQSVEIYHSGSVGQIYSYDRTGSAWLPLLVYGSTVALYGSNVLGLTVAGGGRVLVGTTTDDGVNALQVNGTAKATSIKFANTGGTKQALDYYEEGTWIPNGVGLVITGSPGYSGTYTRIGRTVYITGAVTGAATIGLVAGATISTNLPFTATTGIHVLGAVNGTALTSTTLAAQTVSLYATTAFTSGTAFYFSGTYAI